MNEDKLKKWIKAEQDELESELPREGLWAEIEGELHGKVSSPKKNHTAWRVAASIAVLMTLVFFYQSKNAPISELAIESEDVEAQDGFTLLSVEMQEAQSFYATQVEDRMGRLAKYPVDADLKEEMDALTDEFKNLQTEMGQGLDDSKVVEAMIDNYRLRLDLLEDLLKALDRGQNDQNKTNDYEL